MSSASQSLLAALNDEITALASTVVKSTAIVTGQTRDFGESSGSAWLYDAQHLVTNNHVIDDLVTPIWVRFSGSPELRTTLVGRDPSTDLAVLAMVEPYGEPLRLRSAPPVLGEICFAFGSPMGRYPESISFGIVSGLKRSLPVASGRAIFDVIQTDCAINPGNSGGPLVGIDGSVLGVNTATAKGSEGIGFAVPARTVSWVVPEILTYGGVQRASLGIGVSLRDMEDGTTRLVVTAVRSKSAGAFLKGDVLLSVGDAEVQSQQDLMRALGRRVVNKKLTVWVSRSGQRVGVESTPPAAEQVR